MRATGVKVLCLDITDQYSTELGTTEPNSVAQLKALSPLGKGNVQKNKEEGGGLLPFRSLMTGIIREFLVGSETLLVLDPGAFEVWRQDTNPYQNSASMSSLTPAEVTREVTQIMLEELQAMGMTDSARACVVFEEAHSLVPEWNSAANPGDQTASNGTAKAILQGRKYGLGCLVITQRTANVTKTILNQCNTVFALRVFDSTGLEFLRNYIGDDFAGVLSTLEDRHAVLFGRASSCSDPVLLKLNDRDVFTAALPELSTNDTAPDAASG